MKETESQLGLGVRFAFGIGAIVAAFLLPVLSFACFTLAKYLIGRTASLKQLASQPCCIE